MVGSFRQRSEILFEPVVPALPEEPLLLHPGLRGGESTGAQGAGSHAALLSRLDQATLLQLSQVLEERRKRHVEGRGEVGHAGRPMSQPGQDRPPSRIGEGLEERIELLMVSHVPK